MSSITVLTEDGSASITVGVPIPIGAGEANSIVDAGQNAHESLVASPAKVSEALQLRGLRAGAGITLTANPTDEVVEIINTAGAAPGDVIGPASSTPNAPTVFADSSGKLVKDPNAAIDMVGQSITNVGSVDGRDVSADGAAQDAHIANVSNPHSVTAAQAGADPAGSAAAVQTSLTTHEGDTTNPHSVTAAQAGADPAGTGAAQRSAHEASFAHGDIPTSAQKLALSGTSGAPGAANRYVTDADPRNADSRAPTGAAGGDLAGTYPNPTIPHVLSTTNPHSVTAAQVGSIPVSEKGNPNGVASLDGAGDVPLDELPERAKSKVDSVADAAARLALSPDEGDVVRQLDTGEFYFFDGSLWLLAPGASTVTGPGSVGDNEIAVYDGTTGQVLKRANAPVSFNAQNIISVGTIDGRDVSVDGAKLDGIEAGAKDDQTITAGVGLTGGGTGDVALAADFGNGAGEIVEGTNPRVLTQAENDAAQGTDGAPSNVNRYVTDSDPRNTDARAPTAHASTHKHGGGDEVAQTAAAVNAIPKADAGGTLAAGWIDDTSHGSLGGGTLHAAATGGAAGFLSSADKTKLDGIDTGATANQNVVAGTGLSGGGSGDTVNLSADIGTGVGQVAAGNDTRFPSQDQNDALDGTNGAPSNSNRYVTNSDPRNSDSRPPTGAAAGQLGGTYPNPEVHGLRETGGPTLLTMSGVADGQVLLRSGTNIVGSNRIVSVSAADTTPGYLNDEISAGVGVSKAILNPAANEKLELAVNLPNSNASATGLTTTASTTDVVMSGMTLTPGAGTYLVSLGASLVGGGANSEIAISIYAAGSQVVGTERLKGYGNNEEGTQQTSAVVTVAAAQAIEGRWRSPTGATQEALDRRLDIVRIA